MRRLGMHKILLFTSVGVTALFVLSTIAEAGGCGGGGGRGSRGVSASFAMPQVAPLRTAAVRAAKKTQLRKEVAVTAATAQKAEERAARLDQFATSMTDFGFHAFSGTVLAGAAVVSAPTGAGLAVGVTAAAMDAVEGAVALGQAIDAAMALSGVPDGRGSVAEGIF